MNTQVKKNDQYNTAKIWQLLLFGGIMGATNIHMVYLGSFLMLYCTQSSFVVSAVAIGTLMTVTRIFDAITDPIIGLWIDKTDTKLGRFRPWMIAGSLIINISLIAMFWGVNFESTVARFTWIAVWYFIWVIGYTFHTACNKGGAIVLTNNPKQRPIVGGVGMLVTVAAMKSVMTKAVPYMNSHGGFKNPVAWRNFAFFVSFVSISITIMAVIGIWGKDNKEHYSTTSKKHEKRKLSEYVGILKGNRPLQMLLVAASTNKIAQQFQSATLMFFFMIVIGDVGLQPSFSSLTLNLKLLGTAVGIILAIKLGNKKSFVIGSWLAVIFGSIILLIRPFDVSQFNVFLVLLSIFSFMDSATSTNVNPMIADITDYENLKNGRFVPGMISTAFSFIDKFTSSFATAVVGAIIGVYAYTQGMEVTSGLYWAMIGMFIGVPILGHAASIIAMKFYEIDKEFCVNMAEKLHERKVAYEVASEVACEVACDVEG